MQAAVVFTGSGPILVLTSCSSLDDPRLVARLAAKNIGKFVAHEIPIDVVRRWYGARFHRTLSDEHEDDTLRIVDVDGPHIFCHLRLSDLGPAVCCEAELAGAGS